MKTPRTGSGILGDALRASGGAGARLIAAAALLLTGSLLIVLRSCFPPEPVCSVAFIVTAAVALWLTWIAAGTAITRLSALGLQGERPGLWQALGGGLARLPRVMSVLLYALSGVALLAGLGLGILQVVRIPVLGWPLVVILLPVILFLFGGAAAILLRTVLSGHLAAAAAAVEDEGPFNALALSFAWLRKSPIRVLLLRVAGPFVALVHSLPRLVVQALAAGAVWTVLALIAPEASARIERIFLGFLGTEPAPATLTAFAVALVAILYAAWIAAGPAAALFGARAGQYLLLRMRLDGVEPDLVPLGKPREKTLEESGAELIERLDAPVEGPGA
jgi:hypothetical protein